MLAIVSVAILRLARTAFPNRRMIAIGVVVLALYVAGVTWSLARDALSGLATAGLAAGSLVALLRWQASPVLLMAVGAGAGLAFGAHL